MPNDLKTSDQKPILNSPDIWRKDWPVLKSDTHKHQRGRLVVFTGPANATGAARLAARAGLRIGAGLVTLASPPAALMVNSVTSTSVMVKRWEGADQTRALMSELRATASVIGPALGVGDAARKAVLDASHHNAPLVLDADALTSFEDQPDALFEVLRASDVLTPHAGEFERLFPGLLALHETKMDAVLEAAKRAGCVVLLKGAQTVIASPEGRMVVNEHASPYLATAGAGDVLAGMIGGLLAQGMTSFEATCAAVWLHGDAGMALGMGLISDDLIDALPGVMKRAFIA